MSTRGAPSCPPRSREACLKPPGRSGCLLFLCWMRQTGVFALPGSSGGEEKAREDGEGGWQGVRSEYDGVDAFASDRCPVTSSSRSSPPSPASSSLASSGDSRGGMFSWCLLLASSSLPAELWWMTPPALKPGLLAGSGGGDQKASPHPPHSSFAASPLPFLSSCARWALAGQGWAPAWVLLFSSFPPSAAVPEGGKMKRGDHGALIFFQS